MAPAATPSYTAPVMDHGMLTFQTREDLDRTLIQLNHLSFDEYEAWEKAHGLKTIYGEFNRIIAAEDEVNDYYSSLPEEEQEYFRTQPEVHSKEYDAGLEDKIIKIVPDEHGGYFEYAVVDPAFAPVLNIDGLVRVADRIYQYTDDAVKIITDGDFAKIPDLIRHDGTENLKAITVFYLSGQNQAKSFEKDWTKILAGRDFEETWDIWKDKRWRVWIDGHSNLVELYNDFNPTCAKIISCTHQIRSQAQRKNFWGKYRYTNHFSPQLDINHSWSYNFYVYGGGQCNVGGVLVWSDFVPIIDYNCTGGPNPCPTSPVVTTYPSTNNGYIYQTPHGVWDFYEFAEAVDATGTLDATYHGTTWNINY
jgi:hypothetical protein